MQFDSNLAWNEAVARVRANRDVLMALAGVFFLLPALLSSVFLADIQQQMMELAQDSEGLEALISANLGTILAFGIGGMLVQFVGYLAATVILGVGGRPSVGEAISVALRAVPTLIGATLLYIVGITLVSFVLGLLVALGSLVAGTAGASLGGVVMLIGLFGVSIWSAVRLSLLVPVIVREGLANPVAAMRRSWELTGGHTPRLLGFYALLMLGYLAISFMVSLLLITPLSLVFGAGAVTNFLAGVVAGLIGAVSNVLLVAVLVRVHAQLSRATPDGQASLFD